MNSVKEYPCIVADSICEPRILSAVWGRFFIMSTELQQLNGQNKVTLWAERISECRNSGLSVKTWCKEKGVCEQTYYKWRKKIFAMAKAQQKLQIAEVTPVMTTNSNCQIAISIHARGIAANIHNGADPATVESVLRILNWIRLPTRCSCSADGGETVSRACTGKRMASSCCTSDWSRARINGRA